MFAVADWCDIGSSLKVITPRDTSLASVSRMRYIGSTNIFTE
jgi:hypothetical protein